ncbi:MAG: flagellar biosynthesis protein FlgL [Lachnospiraceae bacterium]|nr:flagellar biosynthesis protein FlgL [Lachnospiraceae bacterium]MBR1567632.1 flagellar biosynthesis protein FlgL [Lachnospiraceae bacterium]
MRINHNITAMLANNTLTHNDDNMAKAIQRLSSGYKINQAKDDAAGLAISQKMRTQIRGLQQARRNSGDGISVIETAEGALNEVHSMLQRMKELSVKAANDVNSAEDRQTIQDEIDVLLDEIQRISETTQFNQKSLLNGDIGRATYIDTGSVVKGVTTLEISDSVNLDEYNFTVKQDARQAVAVGGSISMSESDTITAEQAGTITINGEFIEISEGDTAQDVFTKLQDLCDWTGNRVFTVDSTANTAGLPENAGYEPSSNAFGNGGQLVIVSDYYGSAERIEISCSNDDLANILGIQDSTVVGSDVEVELGDGFSPTATVSTDGNLITISDSSGFEMVFEAKTGACGSTFTDPTMGGDQKATATGGTAFDSKVNVLDAGQMVFQIGTTEEETMTVTIPEMSIKRLGLYDINVVCGEDARAAIEKVDKAISEVSAVRAKLGAYQNRLEHTESNLEISEESMTTSLSRIMDCDMAAEMTEYTQQNILVQTATNMLSKANARPESVLQLLQQG